VWHIRAIAYMLSRVKMNERKEVKERKEGNGREWNLIEGAKEKCRAKRNLGFNSVTRETEMVCYRIRKHEDDADCVKHCKRVKFHGTDVMAGWCQGEYAKFWLMRLHSAQVRNKWRRKSKVQPANSLLLYSFKCACVFVYMLFVVFNDDDVEISNRLHCIMLCNVLSVAVVLCVVDLC